MRQQQISELDLGLFMAVAGPSEGSPRHGGMAKLDLVADSVQESLDCVEPLPLPKGYYVL
jgi:hypothetical protein